MTSRQWYQYERALERSELQWKRSTKDVLERHPVPDLKFDGKKWNDWKPKINK